MAPTQSPRRVSVYLHGVMNRVSPTDDDTATGAAVTETRRRRAILPGADVLLVALIGLALGLAATALVVVRGWDPGAMAAGPWVTRPGIGTTAIDPYARAELARSGAVPMAANEGLSFTATIDDTAYRLIRSCTYRLGGAWPPARFWTLTATDDTGLTLDNAGRRSAFSSASVLRDIDGTATIEIGPRARPGNWLPLSGSGPLRLTLRLYETPLAGTPRDIRAADLPSITRQSCEPTGTGGRE